ncbi:MAG: glycosyltransferase family 2 protein [Sphaerospermopsis sp. SIO1G1]|nr:glycosyltransferase family 2 protein [Sphaerospermopsis sp. SIO1G1]
MNIDTHQFNSNSVNHHRRLKATTIVLLVWCGVILLHLFPATRIFMLGLTIILAVQVVRMLIAKTKISYLVDNSYFPIVSILIPAKNESAVLPAIINNLSKLDYPRPNLDIWVIDDGSTDETFQILNQLQMQFPYLQVHQRESTGGKSGALNSVFPETRGEVILICDADAKLPVDFLHQTLPRLQNQNIAAVQIRKSIYNAETNFFTRCQQMEMSCDSFLQTHRIAIGGMSELRGNGMLVKREFLEKCHGWNEDTVTDDLDMCFRLYLAGGEIEFASIPFVQEEGVTNWRKLWLQRRRWAEGGYQRYLDYFPQIFTLGWQKEIDLLLFFILQFILPIGLIPELILTIFYSHNPVLLPLQTLLGIILTVAFMVGIYQYQNLRGLSLIWATFLGSLYMLHWIPVMIVTTLKMCVQTEHSVWVRTEHKGIIND